VPARIRIALVLATLAAAAWPPAPGLPLTGQAPAPARQPPPPERAAELEARVVCGTSCHRLPPPDILPAASWRDEIARMAFIRQGGTEPVGPPGTAARSIVLPDDMARVLRDYQSRAPERLPDPSPWPTADASRFARRTLRAADAPPTPAVSHVRVVDVDGDGRLEIVVSDMRYGVLMTAAANDPDALLRTIARAANPSHFSLVDLDADGIRDFLVADLGRFLPADHTEGAVVWMRGTGAHGARGAPGARGAGAQGASGARGARAQGAQSAGYLPLSIDGWPRVADVEAGDFNGDARPDLVVASFGWRKVGRLSILENRTEDYDRPSFAEHVIDPRPGAVHAIPADIDRDGHLDVVAVLAQQFETIVAYLGTGAGFALTPKEIYAAPHPNWGSSGIDLVDLDRDGDLDVLYTHGDTFDDQVIKPYHGIQWLENTGGFPFVEHSLADLPGVFRAQAGDLDGDGDLDIVACAFIAGGSNLDESSMPSLVWMEQVTRGVFERRTLERTAPRHATLDLADIDGDGDLDIVVGNFTTDGTPAPHVEVWQNSMRTAERGIRN
jgi:hypothetical protein